MKDILNQGNVIIGTYASPVREKVYGNTAGSVKINDYFSMVFSVDLLIYGCYQLLNYVIFMKQTKPLNTPYAVFFRKEISYTKQTQAEPARHPEFQACSAMSLKHVFPHCKWIYTVNQQHLYSSFFFPVSSPHLRQPFFPSEGSV